MQGKITKVINMKPIELLGLIEESSGTKLYEVKRTNAIKLMVKKEQKLNEINNVLVEEIEPTLIKLRKEREEYNKFVANNEEIEKYGKMEISYKYLVAKNMMVEKEEQIEEESNEYKALENDIKNIEKEIISYTKEKEKLIKETSVVSEPMKLLLNEKEETEKKILQLKCSLKIEKKENEKEKKKKEQTKNEIKRIEQKLYDYENTDEKNNKNLKAYEEIKKKLQLLKNDLTDKQNTINCLMGAGTSIVPIGFDQTSNSNSSTTGVHGIIQPTGSFREQLKNYKSSLSRTETLINNLLQNSKHFEKEIISLKDEKKKHEKESNEIRKEKEAEEKKKNICEKELEKLNEKYNNFEDMNLLQQEKYKTTNELNMLTQEIQIMKNVINSIKVEYKIPNHIKPGDVFGQIYELIKIKKDYANTALAIHLVVGHKLSYILVHNKEDSKSLFEYNNFSKHSKRVTLLPLDDCIISRDLNERHIQECRTSIGLNSNDNSNVMYFLDIMEYEHKLEKLVKYLFNGTIICSNVELCKKITFNANKRLAFPTITLEGDKFDASGSMSGGSCKNINLFLLHYEKYQMKKLEYIEKEAKLKEINEKLDILEKADDQRKQYKKELQIVINNLENIANRFETSKYGNICKKIEQYTEDIEKGRNELNALYEEQKQLTVMIKKIEKDLSEYENNKDKKEEDLKEAVKNLKNKIKKLEKEKKKKKDEIDDVLLQIENYKKQMEKENNDIDTADEIIKESEIKITELEQNIVTESEKLKELELKMIEHQTNYSSFEKEIKEMVLKIEDLECKKKENMLYLKKMENSLADLKKDFKAASDTAKYLSRTYVWLETSENLLSKEQNTPFDLKNFKYDVIQKKIQSLQNEQNKLSININRKAVQMFEQVQTDYKDLVTKKAQVEEDKKKIQEVIADLDVKKNESLLAMFQQINEYFQAIFSTLLNNAQAKLSIVDGEMSNGIEMKVFTGGGGIPV
uniref:Structural maintenance of chromosomes protein 2-like n=1 Tax=Piliocolobus tephrosceles TaxID=591936 RepID=A0A8C9GH40_9PRIM